MQKRSRTYRVSRCRRRAKLTNAVAQRARQRCECNSRATAYRDSSNTACCKCCRRRRSHRRRYLVDTGGRRLDWCRRNGSRSRRCAGLCSGEWCCRRQLGRVALGAAGKGKDLARAERKRHVCVVDALSGAGHFHGLQKRGRVGCTLRLRSSVINVLALAQPST